ncbi:MAG: DegT/DnrJ/EryC1/StrS family aminotransferase [Parabacteroides sp.]
MTQNSIQMVDLHRQYLRLQHELDVAMQQVLDRCAFINGTEVKQFSEQLAHYMDVPYVIPCGNGTDALQIALMALELQPGDEVIVPDFTYVAAAETAALLGLTPVFVDVEADTFNLDPAQVEAAITERTKAIMAVHLFGQCCDMAPLMQLAEAHHLYVVEDNAQSMGAVYTFPDGRRRMAGTMGHIATTSFFPSKPLACYGDGGAITTTDPVLAERARMIANHGQSVKYHHRRIGCNSRLDTLQAAVLQVKLRHIEEFTKARQKVAAYYDKALQGVEGLRIPYKAPYSSHVYHQYTVQVSPEQRDDLQRYLKEKWIPSMIYYPLPLHRQEAFQQIARCPASLDKATRLPHTVLSLPIHTEMGLEEIEYIVDTLRNYGK